MESPKNPPVQPRQTAADTPVPTTRSHYIRIPDDILDSLSAQAPWSDLIVASVGFRCGEDRNIGYDVDRLSDEHLVKFCTKGSGWLEFDGVRFAISPGERIACPAGHRHRYGADRTDPWSVHWAYYRGTSAAALHELLMQRAERRPVSAAGPDARVEGWFREMHDVLSRGYAAHHVLHASNLLKLILSHWIGGMGDAAPVDGRTAALDDAVRQMMVRMDRPMPLEELASRAGVTRDHFIRIFAARYGYTPMDYFMRMRVQRACELLVTTDLKLSAIADQLGFCDAYHLSKAFRAKTGMSPGKYRKRDRSSPPTQTLKMIQEDEETLRDART